MVPGADTALREKPEPPSSVVFQRDTGERRSHIPPLAFPSSWPWGCEELGLKPSDLIEVQPSLTHQCDTQDLTLERPITYYHLC